MRRLLLALLLALAPVAARAQVPGCVVGQQCVILQSFVPLGSGSLAATSVSSTLTLPVVGSTLGVLVTNAGPATAYLALGPSNVVATTSGNPLAAGASVWLPQATFTTLAAVTASGAAALSIVDGTGAPIVLSAPVQIAAGASVATTGSVGQDFSANPPTAPANLLATVPSAPGRNALTVENESSESVTLILDDGTTGTPTLYLLPSATSPLNTWKSQTFKGRLRVYGATSSDAVAIRQE